MKTEKNRAYLIIICLLAFTMMFLMNHFTPMHADDYDYSFSFYNGERIQSLKDVFFSQISHYQIQNGRIATLGLAQILLMFNATVIDIILSALFVLLGLLILYHAYGFIWDNHYLKLAMIYIALFVFTPSVGQSYLWTNSASIYLGGVVMILIYLIPYRMVLRNDELGREQRKGLVYNIVLLVWMILMGFIAGDTNENMSAGLLFAVLGYLIIFHIKKIRIQPWMLGIGNLLGMIAMYFAPGNQKRVSNAGGISLLGIPKRFVLVTALFLEKMWFLVLILAVIIAVIVLFCRTKETDFKLFLISLPAQGYIYLIGALASVYSMILLSFFPIKAWSFSVTFSIIVLLSLENELKDLIDNPKSKRLVRVAVTAIILVFCGIYTNAFFTVKSANYENDKRLAIINEAIENGEDTATIPAILDYNKYTPYEESGELSWDSNEWPNKAIARYYGLKEIIRDDNPYNYK